MTRHGLWLLYSRRTLSGREVLPGQARPRSYFACSWAFILRPSEADGTRLIVRTRIDYHPAWVVHVVAVIRSGDTVMQRAMLTGHQAPGGGKLIGSLCS